MDEAHLVIITSQPISVISRLASTSPAVANEEGIRVLAAAVVVVAISRVVTLILTSAVVGLTRI